MADVSAAWTSFNSGELSPRMDGRVDMAEYMKGARIMLNWLPTVQGAMVRRGGTRFLGYALTPSKASLLLPFSRSRTESYLLEFSNGLVRFFFGGAVVLNGPAPYLLSTPYSAPDLFNADGTPAISTAESVDQIYAAHPKYAPQVLSFYAPTSWTILPLQNKDGPWNDGNSNQQITMYVTGQVAVNSAVTVSASQAVFQSGHVGALLRIHQQDLSTVKPWQAGQKTPVVTVGVQRRSGFNTYQCISAAAGTPPSGASGNPLFVQTGGNTLTHTSGSAWDGDQSTVIDPIGATTWYSTGMEWSYQDCGYGVILITGVTTDGKTAQGIVQRQLPKAIVGVAGASYVWELGAWNGQDGYPNVVTFYNQRLTFGGRSRLWMSVVGDFPDFADLLFGEVVADSAVTTQVLSEQVNNVRWLAPQTTLIVGTEGGEFVVGQQSISDPYGPTNSRVSPQSNYGGRACGAIRVQTNTLFVQQNGRSLREFQYVFASDAYQSRDMTVLSEHITQSGIVGMAWAKNPYYIVWCVLGNGTLAAFTYNPENAVSAWHRHNVAGGKVVSVATVPSVDGTVDDVYFCVHRQVTVNTITTDYYTIEKMEQPLDLANGDAQQDAFYVDCGLTLANTINASLNITGDATIVGNSCAFIASLGVFKTTDVGRYIHYDWTTTQIGDDGLPYDVQTKGIAQITALHTGSFNAVDATIVAPFPQLFGVSIPANGWRMTVTTITGASVPTVWMGQTLSILADGAVQPDIDYPETVTPPDIAINPPASVIQIGIKSPAVWQSMRPDIGDASGPPIGKKRRIVRATVRVLDELGLKLGRTVDDCDPIAFQSFDVPSNTAPPLHNGNSDRLSFDGTVDDDGRVMLVADQPLPATVCAVGVTLQTQEDS